MQLSSVPRTAAIDLHLHTTYSDGHWEPDELFEYLGAEQFRVVSVTDHDTLTHGDQLRLLGEARGITVLAGVEVTSRWRSMIAHVLCYANQFTTAALAGLIDKTSLGQLENTQAVYAELERRGYRFPRRDETLAASKGQLLRPIDNAHLLVSHGHVNDQAEALNLIRDAGYVIVAAPIEMTLQMAHESGAVAVLAHPGRSGGEIQQYEPPVIEEMLHDAPLDGIEVYYPSHSEEQIAAYQALAVRRGLLVSAGSDSHGPRQRLPIPYQAVQCGELLARCGITIIP